MRTGVIRGNTTGDGGDGGGGGGTERRGAEENQGAKTKIVMKGELPRLGYGLMESMDTYLQVDR